MIRQASWLLLFVLGFAISCGGEQVVVATPAPVLPSANPLAFWTKFRESYPLHAQGVALSNPEPDGSRIVIVAEPPPDIALSDLQATSAVFAEAKVLSHRLGHDGWTKDVAAVVPAEVNATDLTENLERTLFGTSYRGFLLPVPPPTANGGFEEPDVTLSDLCAWLHAPAQRVTGLLDHRAVPLKSLFGAARAGVYLSEVDGLVLWVLPRGSLGDDPRDFRMFALESDLIVGAAASPNAVIVVGRRRALSPVTYPPLRFESVRALAAAGDFELAQSFERTSIAAGAEQQGDVAPIYLSAGIVDTEIGSDLNIADQLLKSWSTHGMTSYENFNYAAGDPFPFQKGVQEMLGAESLRFNWNTQGFSTTIDFDDYQVLDFNDLGSLPISYFPDEDVDREANHDKAEELADQARIHFSKVGDPYLIRAAQYAALYTILSEFDFQSESNDEQAIEKTQEITKTYVTDALKKLAAASDADLTKAARTFLQSRAQQSLGGPTAENMSNVVQVLKALREQIRSLSPESQSKGAERIATGTGLTEGGRIVQVLARLFLDSEGLKKALASAKGVRDSSWIRTPDLVVSHNAVKDLVGGHSIRPLPTAIVTTDQVPRGKFAVLESGAFAMNRVDFEAAGRPIAPKLHPGTTALAEARPGRAWVTDKQPGGRAVGARVSKTAEGYTVAILDEAGNTLESTAVPTSAGALDVFESRAASPTSTLRRLELANFDGDGAENFTRNIDMRDQAAGRMQILKPGEREFDLASIRRDYQVEGARFTGAHTSAIGGGTEVKLTFEMQARAQGRRGLIVAVKQWFRAKTPEALTSAVTRFRDTVVSILDRWRKSDTAGVDDLARAIRKELREETKRRPTLRIELQSEAVDSHFVEVEPVAPMRGPT